MRLPAIAAALIGCALSALLHAAKPPINPAPGFQPNDYLVGPEPFTLPFHLINGHIFIDGVIDGRRGKFMFDTGTEFAFFLNNHFLPLRKQTLIGRGHAGSGQEMVLYRQRQPLARVSIGKALRYDGLTGFTHTDWGFLEEGYGIPAFFGSIGHELNRNFAFVIDYDLQTIDFHPYAADGTAPTMKIDPTRIMARLAFTATGVDGKMPEVAVHIGGHSITAVFDTGNPGSLGLSLPTRKALEQEGLLQVTPVSYAYGSYGSYRRANVSGLGYGDIALVDLRNLDFNEAKADRIGLGYQFLKHYISVWDYQSQTLTLLRR